MRVLERWFETKSQILRRKCTIRYDTFAPLIFASVPPLTSRFPKIMMAGGISPYHCLRTDNAPSKRIVVTPTSGGKICALGLGLIQLKPYSIILSTDNVIEGFFLEQGETMNLHLLPELALLNPLLTHHNSPPHPRMCQRMQRHRYFEYWQHQQSTHSEHQK